MDMGNGGSSQGSRIKIHEKSYMLGEYLPAHSAP